jgi:hypothetical protein
MTVVRKRVTNASFKFIVCQNIMEGENTARKRVILAAASPNILLPAKYKFRAARTPKKQFITLITEG